MHVEVLKNRTPETLRKLWVASVVFMTPLLARILRQFRVFRVSVLGFRGLRV